MRGFDSHPLEIARRWRGYQRRIKMSPTASKYQSVPMRFKRDVAEFIEMNHKRESIGDLSPREFLEYYLHWNGVVGYTSEIVTLMEALGWRAPK